MLSTGFLMARVFYFLLIVFTLSACGGGGKPVVTSFNAVKLFSDGAGVGRATSSDGERAYFISPDIVDLVYFANFEDDSALDDDIDIQNYPLEAQVFGYDFRSGVENGITISGWYKTGSYKGADASVVFMFPPIGDQIILAGVSELKGAPTGTYSYNGIYTVHDRAYDFDEGGLVSISANFSNKTFTINASSPTTQLTGSGFLDINSGQISSTMLNFVETGVWSSKASLLGAVGGRNGSAVSGVWHTNESSPEYEGSFIGHR